jgi:hypothetical protein
MALNVPYIKQTWIDGSGGGTPVSAVRLSWMEQGINDVSQAPAVRVFHNANQTLTTATNTALAFNSERFDQAGGASAAHHDTVTNNTRLTCLYAGVYQITGNIDWASGSTGFRQLAIRLGGATFIAVEERAASSGSVNRQNVTTLYALAVNDYVELVATHTQGANLAVVSSANFSPEFMFVRVG